MAWVEAVIVAGGFGTRMMPLTRDRPKHLLPLAGVPLVAHQLGALAAAGVERVVLATSYFAEQFEPTLGDGSAWGVRLVYVREAEPLGTGGAIRNAAGHLRSAAGAPVVVLNGDIISSHDLRAQLARHQQSGADVTLHLVDVDDPRRFGCVPTDEDDVVLAFLEKDPEPVTSQVNAGCYVFDRSVIDRIPTGAVVSVERETFPGLLSSGATVRGYRDSSYWADVGTPEALRSVSCDVVQGAARSHAYDHGAAEAWVASSAEVHETAVVTGGTAVGPGSVVGTGAVVDGCVVEAGVVVGPGAELRRCVVAAGTVVAAGARLADQVVVADRP
jgi:mannose-1-phosphate guanylyltransferase